MLHLKPTDEDYAVTKNHRINITNPKVDYKNIVCVKPWGHEFLIYESSKIGIWCLTLNKTHSTSIHTHFQKDTFIIVADGCAIIRLLNNESVVLNKMDSIFIPKKKFHGISCYSDSITLIEIEIFNENLNFSDKNDLLRVDDQYKRDKTGYEGSVKNITDNIEAFGYFYLTKGQRAAIKNTNLVCQEFDTTKTISYMKNNYNILLDGRMFINGQHIKEGSVLHNNQLDSLTFYDTTPLLLSISCDDYLEDSKIIYDKDHLKHIVRGLKKENLKLVLTSGCYDILHVGHLNNLRTAKSLGDKLIVCLSSDEQIKKLKGEKRPINNYKDRINLFKTISYVDYIVLYNEENIEKESTLDEIMKIVNPDLWTKGSDYTKEQIFNKHPCLKDIVLIDNVQEKSTTAIIQKILDR